MPELPELSDNLINEVIPLDDEQLLNEIGDMEMNVSQNSNAEKNDVKIQTTEDVELLSTKSLETTEPMSWIRKAIRPKSISIPRAPERLISEADPIVNPEAGPSGSSKARRKSIIFLENPPLKNSRELPEKESKKTCKK